MKITKQEWILLVFISTLLLAWSSLPTWTGYTLQNKELSFTGTYFDPLDYAVHMAMLRAGMQGDTAYSFRFTTEPHQAYYIRIFYIELGQINRIFDADPKVAFQIAKWVFGYAALFSLFGLVKQIFKSPREQWLAFSLAVLGSGLGYVQLIFGWVPGTDPPVDLWLTDAYYFMSLAIFPHFAFTLALMCLALWIYLDFLRSGGWWKIVLIVVAALTVQLVNPIAFLVVDGTIAVVTIFTWLKNHHVDRSQLYSLVGIAIAQIPLLLYTFLLFSKDPIWSQFVAQNKTPSPQPMYYVWGFAFFWPLVILGTIQAWRRRDSILLACATWIISAFLLAYAPFAIQRRFLLGITIPLAFVATPALNNILDQLSKRIWLRFRGTTIPAIFGVALISMTTLIFIPAYTLYMQSRPLEYYYPHGLEDAFAWLRVNSQPDDFVFGAEDTGRLVAEETGRRVYLGHKMETLNYISKGEDVQAFYHNELPDDWLTRLPIQWVIYGPYERAISVNYRPAPNLVMVYQREGVEIYRVK